MSVRWQFDRLWSHMSGRTAHTLAAAICVVVSLRAASLRGDDVPATRDVMGAWQSRSTAVQLAWKHDVSGAYAFHRYQADWLPVNDEGLEHERLVIDTRRLRFESARWTIGEHGYDRSQFGSVQVIADFPERVKQDPYLTALRSHFEDPLAEFRDLRPFVRVFDGAVLRDYWPAHADEYPRGVIQTCLPVVRTAALRRSISDELQDLSLIAAILGSHPLHPSLALPIDNYEVAAEPVMADGDPCAVLHKPQQEATGRRITIWVDPSRDFNVRRFISDDGSRGYQIDIEYRRDEHLGWAPSGWTVCTFGDEQGARLDAVRCLVTRVSVRDSLTSDESTVRFDADTWVVDEIAKEQYILRDDETKREIRTEEFDWLPTHGELSATETGEVGTYIEHKLRWIQYWRSARIPLVLGVTSIGSAAALAIWRRRRRSTPQQFENSETGPPTPT